MNTAIFSELNWLAVLVGGLAYFALGAIWYSFLFKNAWIKASGVKVDNPEARKKMAQTMISSLLLMIVASLVLAILIHRVGSSGWMTGCKLGLLCGFGFSFTATSISYLYEDRPLALHLINGFYTTTGCTLAGIIIAAWG